MFLLLLIGIFVLVVCAVAKSGKDSEFAEILQREFAEEDAMWDAVESGDWD